MSIIEEEAGVVAAVYENAEAEDWQILDPRDSMQKDVKLCTDADVAPICWNYVEQCDGSDVRGAQCIGTGLTGQGSVACTEFCAFDYSGCERRAEEIIFDFCNYYCFRQCR